MHRAAERAILRALRAAGLLLGEVDDMMEHKLGAVFMPHGLGHLIGCDTHDVGGYLPGTPERIQIAGINKLRTARFLEEGMVLTVEPGIYFIAHTIDQARANPAQAKFLNDARLDEFSQFGRHVAGFCVLCFERQQRARALG